MKCDLRTPGPFTPPFCALWHSNDFGGRSRDGPCLNRSFFHLISFISFHLLIICFSFSITLSPILSSYLLLLLSGVPDFVFRFHDRKPHACPGFYRGQKPYYVSRGLACHAPHVWESELIVQRHSRRISCPGIDSRIFRARCLLQTTPYGASSQLTGENTGSVLSVERSFSINSESN